MSYQDLHPANLQTLRAEPDLLILDMRDPASLAQGRIEGAEAVSDALLGQLMRRRQRERPVVVYCYHGNSSRDLCQFIAGFGYTRVYNLVGGWQGWMQLGQTEPASPRSASPSPALSAWLMERGFPADSLHARIDNGMSPLMLAALQGERALVEELLALGADPNHVNDDDHHALWFACVHGDPELVSLLVAHGADVDNQNVNGATCAIYAASTGKLEVLRRLVEAGAKLDTETSGGYTALESASTLRVLKYLRGVVQAA
jgi:rhodanese-related sulfurtransferase